MVHAWGNNQQRFGKGGYKKQKIISVMCNCREQIYDSKLEAQLK